MLIIQSSKVICVLVDIEFIIPFNTCMANQSDFRAFCVNLSLAKYVRFPHPAIAGGDLGRFLS